MGIVRNAVNGTHKVGHKTGGRALIDALRRIKLHQTALLHHRDAIAQRHRLLLIVRDVNGSDRQPLEQRANLQPQSIAQPGIKRRQRLIKQQHFRPGGQRASQCHPLLLPTGQFINRAM